MEKQSFIAGAFVLTLAGLLSRVMGAMYRIPLSRMMGPEGLGLYEMAYPIYGILLAVSLGGVPLAISKLVAERTAMGDVQGARKVFYVSFAMLMVSGILCSVLLFYYAHFFATHFLGDSRVYYCLISVAPAVFFVSLMSVFRGLYQGVQVMNPTAVSQVVEQFIRMVTMLLLAYLLLPYGVAYAAAGATFGAVTGGLAGCVYLFFYHGKHRKHVFAAIARKNRVQESSWSIVCQICCFSLPIILGGLAVPLMNAIYAVLVPIRLQTVGYTMREATNLYGQLTGMAVTLMNFPTVITAALSTSLVPAIAQAFALKESMILHRQALEAIRLTFLIALPAAVGLHVLSGEICGLLFACPSAGLPLKILAFGTIFLCLHETVSAVLQGVGKTALPVRNILLGTGCNMLGIYFFTSSPNFAIQGVALSTVIGFALATVLDLWDLKKMTGLAVPWLTLLSRPLLAVWGMALMVRRVYEWSFLLFTSNAWSIVFAVLSGMVTYLLLLFVFGALQRTDFLLLKQIGIRR